MISILVDVFLLGIIYFETRYFLSRIDNHRDLISRQTELLQEHWNVIKQLRDRIDTLENR